jgi:hypothetical protein
MLTSYGPTVDVGVSGVCRSVSILLVFWWAFFMESPSGTGSQSGMPSLRTQA